MVTFVLADVGLGPIIRDPAVPLLVSLGLFVAIVVSEGAVLWAFRRKSWGRSLLHAFIMNLVSTIVGFVLAVLYLLLLTQLLISLSSGIRLTLFVLATWLSSVLIEGLVLRGLKWEGNARTWKALVVANIVSYLILAGAMVSLRW